MMLRLAAGLITTLAPLNRETLHRHQLTIMVRDQATPSKRSLARVVVYVIDHNDHAPTFLQGAYEGRVFETAAVGTNVLRVVAVDRDVGENAKLDYSIVSGSSCRVRQVASSFLVVLVMYARWRRRVG